LAERIDWLRAIASEYEKRLDDMAAAIPEETGAPAWLVKNREAA
jgi:aldehyde dehydrogenase (NAD+)